MDKHSEISFDDYDELINPRPDENDFDKVLEIALTRRGLLKSVLAVGSVASLGSWLPSHRVKLLRQATDLHSTRLIQIHWTI